MIAFLAVCLAALAAAAAVYWRWARAVRADIADAAASAFERLSTQDPDLVARYDAARFASIFERVHFPRFPAYALAAVAAFLAALPVLFALMSALLRLLQASGFYGDAGAVADGIDIRGRDPATVAHRREVVLYLIETYSGALYLFGVLLFWLVIVYVAMKRYHARRPGYLHDELIRNRPGEP
jgi:hypothetical protein